jgi:hypothetical protein
MKSYGCLGLALCGGLFAVSAYGYGTVTQCTPGYSEGTHYSVDYDAHYPPQIVILQPSIPGAPYWFECREGDDLAAIYSITIAFVGDPGPVTISICAAGDEDSPGATDVWRLDLTGATPGTVQVMRISGNYGEVDDGDTLLADRAGTLSIGTPAIGSVGAAHGDVIKPVHILGDVDSLTVRGAVRPEGTVTIDGDLSALSIATLSGELEVNGNLGSGQTTVTRLDGSLTVTAGDVTGPVSVDELVGCFNVVAGDVAPESGNFAVTILAGTLKTGGDLGGEGAFSVLNVCPQGLIDVGGSVTRPLTLGYSDVAGGAMSGTLHVAGGPGHTGGIYAPIEFFAGSGGGPMGADVTGLVLDDGCLDSSIHALWDLAYSELPTDPVQYGGRIVISGAVTANGSITIGQDVNGGQIEVGSLAGSIEIGRDIGNDGAVAVTGDLNGTLTVDHAVQQDGSIQVGQDINGGHVAIGMSAWHAASKGQGD